MNSFDNKIVFFFVILANFAIDVQGHGRLMEPPSRASMWRVGYSTPVDENDNQGYCGGFGVQFNRNHGKCGICGDPWDVYPRPHEAPGGIYANGIITKTYTQGSLIPVIIDLSANHKGHFIFKICPNNNVFEDPDQTCFDRHPLKTGPGTYRYRVEDGLHGLTMLYVRLPPGLSCSQCILQWTYVGGNNWGVCSNGTSGIGCGDQEHFRSCADIRILPSDLAIILNEYLEERESEDLSYEDEDYFGDEDDSEALQVLNSIENENDKRELRKKVLESLLERMKELISLTQPPQTQDYSSNIDENLESLDEKEEERKMSNRHG